MVDFLLLQMQPDDKWLERTEHGFKWAYSKFGQEVTIEEIRHPDDPEALASVVNISSPMLEDLEDTAENRKTINDYLCYNTSVCTPVVDLRRKMLFLNFRAPVNEDIVDWMEKLLSIAMVIEQHEVLKNAEQLAQLTHSRPAHYNHPSSGIREDVDEILKIYDDLLIPFGRMANNCTADEIRNLASTRLQGFPFVLTNYSDTGITAELPMGVKTSLLEFDTKEPHPDYGCGVNVKHSFFSVNDEDKGIKLAMYHNRQLSIALRSYGIGSFLYRNGYFVYRLFFPNFAYNKGMLWNLCLSSILKAQGINRYLKLPEWNKDSVQICLEAKMKALFGMFPDKKN